MFYTFMSELQQKGDINLSIVHATTRYKKEGLPILHTKDCCFDPRISAFSPVFIYSLFRALYRYSSSSATTSFSSCLLSYQNSLFDAFYTQWWSLGLSCLYRRLMKLPFGTWLSKTLSFKTLGLLFGPNSTPNLKVIGWYSIIIYSSSYSYILN